MRYAGRYATVLLSLILLSTLSIAQPVDRQASPENSSTGLGEIAVSSNFNFHGVAPSSTGEGAVTLDGFINFRNTGYDLAVESERENSTVEFYVEIIESEGEFSGQAITREDISETVEASPGEYTATLEVSHEDRMLLEKDELITVPDRVEKDPENMTREELINEVRQLRERVEELEERENEPEPPMNTPDNKESNDSVEGDNRPDEIPGEENSNRPGFVRGLLSGLFG